MCGVVVGLLYLCALLSTLVCDVRDGRTGHRIVSCWEVLVRSDDPVRLKPSRGDMFSFVVITSDNRRVCLYAPLDGFVFSSGLFYFDFDPLLSN